MHLARYFHLYLFQTLETHKFQMKRVRLYEDENENTSMVSEA
jgi:hypothetical protein